MPSITLFVALRGRPLVRRPILSCQTILPETVLSFQSFVWDRFRHFPTALWSTFLARGCRFRYHCWLQKCSSRFQSKDCPVFIEIQITICQSFPCFQFGVFVAKFLVQFLWWPGLWFDPQWSHVLISQSRSKWHKCRRSNQVGREFIVPSQAPTAFFRLR